MIAGDHIYFEQNEAQEMVIHKVDDFPLNPGDAQVCFHKGMRQMFYYDAQEEQWIPFGKGVIGAPRIEIKVTAGMRSNNNRRITDTRLANKSYQLKRRGFGDLASDEYTILPSGGFELTETGDQVGIGEVFFADITPTINYGT
jgi:hypothetical protein